MTATEQTTGTTAATTTGSTAAPSGRGTWMAFLVMAFAIVGLAGLFASFAQPVPLRRALAAIVRLDGTEGTDASRIAAVLDPADAKAALAAPAGTQLAAARAALIQSALADEAATAVRVRWLVALISLTGAAFGVAVLGIAGRPPQTPSSPGPAKSTPAHSTPAQSTPAQSRRAQSRRAQSGPA
jgi:hypothetical protein